MCWEPEGDIAMGDWKIAAIVCMHSDLGDRRKTVALDVSV
jgi:hypothetical protein